MLVAENATAGKKDPAAFKAIHNWLNEKIQEYEKTPGRVRNHRRKARPGRRQKLPGVGAAPAPIIGISGEGWGAFYGSYGDSIPCGSTCR
jgi:hypothetical protein